MSEILPDDFTVDDDIDEETAARLADLEEEAARETSVLELSLLGDGELEVQRAKDLVGEEADDGEPALEKLLGGRGDIQSIFDLSDGPVVPRARKDEFVCTGCFLIWHRRHLADAERRLCRDCADVPASVAKAA